MKIKRRVCLIIASVILLSFAMMISVSAETTPAEVDYGGAFSMERLALAGQVTLVGLLIVFFVLAILWGVISISKIFLYDIPLKKKQKEELAAKVSATVQSSETLQSAKTSAPVISEADTAENDEETVAAITAAVQAYLLAEQGNAYRGGFVVVSFKKRSEAWKSQNKIS